MTALRNCLDLRHSIDIILRLGDAQRARGSAIMSDVVRHSENGARARQIRLHDLMAYGVIAQVREFKHPYNVKHIELTPAGWALYLALSRCITIAEA